MKRLAGQGPIVDVASPASGSLWKPPDHRGSQTPMWAQLSQGPLPRSQKRAAVVKDDV